MRWAIWFPTADNVSLRISQGNRLAPSAPLDKQHRFNKHAQQWNLLRSPLRPCAEDLRLMQGNFEKWHDANHPAQHSAQLKALLLGVTPEIAEHDWGVPTDLTAADISQAMINEVWPGDTPSRRAFCADWLELPDSGLSIHGSTNAFDMILADGVFSLFDYPAGYAKLALTLQRCLNSGGIFMVRQFVRPAVAESSSDVFEDLPDKRIGSFHAFKWRLLMALQGDDIHRGVAVAEAWELYHRRISSHAHLAEKTGWPLEEIATMDFYQGSPAVYTYPSTDELIDVVAPHLLCTSVETGHYELAECCPMFSFRPR
jgi:SAM-dependent methyltransferase